MMPYYHIWEIVITFYNWENDLSAYQYLWAVKVPLLLHVSPPPLLTSPQVTGSSTCKPNIRRF